MTKLTSLIAGLFVSATLWSAPAAAFDIENMSDAERAAFGEAVRSYFLENPLVMLEIVEALETQQAETQATGDIELVQMNADGLFNDGFSWEGGNPDGDVTIVEFIDYRCGFCRRAFPEVTELVQNDGNIRLIVKEYPILGEESELASRFAIAAKLASGPEAYKTVHDGLMEFRGAITPTSLRTFALREGLDADAIIATMQLPRVDEIIDSNRALGQRMAINGTPTFVFGSQMIRGYVPLEGMREIVADQRG
ncbi:MAG: DsbA family protein [Pseudomonadota bacterium]